ncbi:hypothetical protein K9U39_20405 [Rhodoblastus acidophilus]|nr:hypothetical protein [Rhodoblastus acidophilus]
MDDSRIRPAALVVASVLALVTSLLLLRAVLTDDASGSSASSAPTTAHDDSHGDSHGGTGTGEQGADSGTAPVASPLDTRLTRCVSADQALTQALDNAQPALDQWAVHVGAMNKLVVGEITLEQASAFWNRTRHDAATRIEDFRAVMDDVRVRGLDCPGPHYLAPGARQLPPCTRRVAADIRALGAARTSIATWEHHVHDMEMLRSGDLSPEDATAAWLSMWQEGMDDLDTYDEAAREMKQHEACEPRTSSE